MLTLGFSLAFQELPLLAIAIKAGVRARELGTQASSTSTQRRVMSLGHLLQELIYNWLATGWCTPITRLVCDN